ncbi:MAG: GNAT family N-acetyltransferase [Mycobacteriales bacterium]
MAWTAVRVRPAVLADVPALLAFGEQLRDQLAVTPEALRGRGTSAAARETLAARYASALTAQDRHLVVAVDDADVPLGMALFSIAPANALLDIPALHVSHAVVDDRHKRRGAGKALVAAAAFYAEERGLEQVVVSVNPGSRDANRFFARLGFAPLAVRRVAPVSVLRRRLQADSGPSEVLRRRARRPVRLRSGATALPLGAAGPES